MYKSGAKVEICHRKKYGNDLAERVYRYLIEYGSIKYNHYGYCGTGFVYYEGNILYTHIDEWETYRNGARYESGKEYTGIIKSFSNKESFIYWLSLQSDNTLSGKESKDSWCTNNQRITKERLEYVLSESGI